jgi:16S rRNA (uracil1498-N3)-methyltransferase
MHRFFLVPEQAQASEFVLTGPEAHHASRVLRLQPGDPVTVLDGAGNEWHGQVREIDRQTVRLTVNQQIHHLPPMVRVTLVQAIPRGGIMETIIEKATELGVHCIVPLLAERSTVRLDKAGAAAKIAKWRVTAIEAIKQCGSPWLPQIEPPQTLTQYLGRNQVCDLSLLASLQPDSRPSRVALAEYRSQHPAPPHTVALWIGPEGDFTPAESERIRLTGAIPLSLGPLVLRVETAAVFSLSVINHEFQNA